MPDDPDPPRKFYGFKPREFEVANPDSAAASHRPPATVSPPAAPQPPTVPPPPNSGLSSPLPLTPPLPSSPPSPSDFPPPAPDPGVVPSCTGRIDVRDLNRLASTGRPLLSTSPTPVPQNEVHDLLRDNLARANAAGFNEVKIDPHYRTPRQRRIRRFWIMVIVFNLPIGLAAWFVGHRLPLVFVPLIAAMALLTTRLIWEAFFLNTD